MQSFTQQSLVIAGKNDATLAGLAAIDTLALFLESIQRDAADGSLGLFLDFVLGLAGSVPVSKDEATLLNLLLELSHALTLV